MPAPTPAPFVQPTPEFETIHDDSGGNQSLEVGLDYDRYEPSGSNDSQDMSGGGDRAGTVTGSAGLSISFPPPAGDDGDGGRDEIDEESNDVPSNDDRRK